MPAKYRHDPRHQVYGQTSSPAGDTNIFTRRYRSVRRNLAGGAIYLKQKRIAELELLVEIGESDHNRELAKLRAEVQTAQEKLKR